MNNCKNCQWYDSFPEFQLPKHGTCSLYANDELKINASFINKAFTHDEDIFEFSVGENFGCIHFKIREIDLKTGKRVPTPN